MPTARILAHVTRFRRMRCCASLYLMVEAGCRAASAALPGAIHSLSRLFTEHCNCTEHPQPQRSRRRISLPQAPRQTE